MSRPDIETAYHEAGHVVAAYELGSNHPEWVKLLSDDKRHYGGVMQRYPPDFSKHSELQVVLAGWVGEQFAPPRTDGLVSTNENRGDNERDLAEAERLGKELASALSRATQTTMDPQACIDGCRRAVEKVFNRPHVKAGIVALAEALLERREVSGGQAVKIYVAARNAAFNRHR